MYTTGALFLAGVIVDVFLLIRVSTLCISSDFSQHILKSSNLKEYNKFNIKRLFMERL